MNPVVIVQLAFGAFLLPLMAVILSSLVKSVSSGRYSKSFPGNETKPHKPTPLAALALVMPPALLAPLTIFYVGAPVPRGMVVTLAISMVIIWLVLGVLVYRAAKARADEIDAS